MAYHDEYLELISAALDGALSPDERTRLDAHLAQCPDCKALYDQLNAAAQAVRDLPPVEPPADLTDRILAAIRADKVVPITAASGKKQPWKKWLATAAVLAVLAAGGYGMTHLRMGSASNSAAPMSMAPVMEAPAMAEVPSSAPMAQASAEAAEELAPDRKGSPALGAAAPKSVAPESYSYMNSTGSTTAEEDSGIVQFRVTGDSVQEEAVLNTAPAEDVLAPESARGEDQLSASLFSQPSGSGDDPSSPFVSEGPETLLEEEDTMENTITITVGDQTFPVTLNGSPAARALRDALPMTVDMTELNGNEKYVYLPFSLPTEARSVGAIHTGDLMLFGDSCLVLFYRDFSTSYTYTPLGTLDAPALAQILGAGDVTVTLEAK